MTSTSSATTATNPSLFCGLTADDIAQLAEYTAFSKPAVAVVFWPLPREDASEDFPDCHPIMAALKMDGQSVRYIVNRLMLGGAPELSVMAMDTCGVEVGDLGRFDHIRRVLGAIEDAMGIPEPFDSDSTTGEVMEGAAQ
jgi:hypothetical protein